jgi:hypothetical protein
LHPFQLTPAQVRDPFDPVHRHLPAHGVQYVAGRSDRLRDAILTSPGNSLFHVRLARDQRRQMRVVGIGGVDT